MNPPAPAPTLQAFAVAHLPLIRAIVDDLGIVKAVEARSPKHPLARVSDAQCLVVMMLNILCGRVALFRMNDWLDRTDVKLLLGPDAPADAFNDTRLGACLDHLGARRAAPGAGLSRLADLSHFCPWQISR